MREYKPALMLTLALLLCLVMVPYASAQYWFQSGAYGGASSQYNSGAGGYIETIYPQYVNNGSYGFWIGETLNNNAFIQIGYEITNTSGYYPQDCSPSGCNGSTYITAGYPTWFWEYFPANYTGKNFYGGIGPNNSVGINGTFNNYSFMLNGSSWNFYFNNQIVGTVNIGTENSGENSPAAYAELANTNTNQNNMYPVMFKNISYYKNGALHLLGKGYAYIGYGKGSNISLSNPYGVKEVNNQANFFSVGSGLPIVTDGYLLWNNIYRLNVSSQYGNSTGSGYYSSFSEAHFSVPKTVAIGNGIRAYFAGWDGTGPGAYTGPSNSSSVYISGNTTETALWKIQYYLNATSSYGNVSGSGWYNPGNLAVVSINKSLINVSNGTREVFSKWSTGSPLRSISVTVSKPEDISAEWERQYFLGLSTTYGNSIGEGWYDSGSNASISLSQTYFNNTNSSSIAFYSWSGLYNQSNATVVINNPTYLTAIFKKKYTASLYSENEEGQYLRNVTFYLNNGEAGTKFMLFSGNKYNVISAEYKGTKMNLNYSLNLSAPKSFYLKLPVYNLNISAISMLNAPLNASAYVVFSNGSSSYIYLGRNGTVELRNVTFGKVSGYMKYHFITEAFSSVGKDRVTVIFITIDMLALIIGIIAAMIIGMLLHRKAMKREI